MGDGDREGHWPARAQLHQGGKRNSAPLRHAREHSPGRVHVAFADRIATEGQLDQGSNSACVPSTEGRSRAVPCYRSGAITDTRPGIAVPCRGPRPLQGTGVIVEFLWTRELLAQFDDRGAVGWAAEDEAAVHGYELREVALDAKAPAAALGGRKVPLK